MYLYSFILRLGGNVMHSVPREHATAAEVLTLAALHGGDAITQLREYRATQRFFDTLTRDRDTGVVPDERERLDARYGSALSKAEPETSIFEIFGPASMPLPERLKGFTKEPKRVFYIAHEKEDDDVEDDVLDSFEEDDDDVIAKFDPKAEEGEKSEAAGKPVDAPKPSTKSAGSGKAGKTTNKPAAKSTAKAEDLEDVNAILG